MIEMKLITLTVYLLLFVGDMNATSCSFGNISDVQENSILQTQLFCLPEGIHIQWNVDPKTEQFDIHFQLQYICIDENGIEIAGNDLGTHRIDENEPNFEGNFTESPLNTKGICTLFGCTLDYTKWHYTVYENQNRTCTYNIMDEVTGVISTSSSALSTSTFSTSFAALSTATFSTTSTLSSALSTATFSTKSTIGTYESQSLVPSSILLIDSTEGTVLPSTVHSTKSGTAEQSTQSGWKITSHSHMSLTISPTSTHTIIFPTLTNTYMKSPELDATEGQGTPSHNNVNIVITVIIPITIVVVIILLVAAVLYFVYRKQIYNRNMILKTHKVYGSDDIDPYFKPIDISQAITTAESLNSIFDRLKLEQPNAVDRYSGSEDEKSEILSPKMTEDDDCSSSTSVFICNSNENITLKSEIPNLPDTKLKGYVSSKTCICSDQDQLESTSHDRITLGGYQTKYVRRPRHLNLSSEENNHTNLPSTTSSKQQLLSYCGSSASSGYITESSYESPKSDTPKILESNETSESSLDLLISASEKTYNKSTTVPGNTLQHLPSGTGTIGFYNPLSTKLNLQSSSSTDHGCENIVRVSTDKQERYNFDGKIQCQNTFIKLIDGYLGEEHRLPLPNTTEKLSECSPSICTDIKDFKINDTDLTSDQDSNSKPQLSSECLTDNHVTSYYTINPQHHHISGLYTTQTECVTQKHFNNYQRIPLNEPFTRDRNMNTYGSTASDNDSVFSDCSLTLNPSHFVPIEDN